MTVENVGFCPTPPPGMNGSPLIVETFIVLTDALVVESEGAIRFPVRVVAPPTASVVPTLKEVATNPDP